jgi:hypothetical protein
MESAFAGEVVIQGTTANGRPFRPSDWAERLAGVASCVGCDNRLNFSDKVRPVTRGGVRCVVVDRSLEQEDPRLFRFLMDFARQNDLSLCQGRQAARD